MKEIRRKMLALEDYAAAVENPERRSELKIKQLNQVITMHGFLKLYQKKKEQVLQAMEGIELMPAAVAEMQQGAGGGGGGADLTMAELGDDLDALGWGECRVQHVVTVGSCTDPKKEKKRGAGSMAETSADKPKKKRSNAGDDELAVAVAGATKPK